MLRPLQSVSQRLRALQALQHGAWEVTRSLGSSGAGEQAGGEATAAAAAAAGAPARGAGTSTPERVARVIATAFHKAPKDTANALVKELTELDRIHLVLALQRNAKNAAMQQAEVAYVEDLVKSVGREENRQHRKLTKHQIHNAVIYQRWLQRFASASEEPPSVRQLSMVGFASGLPFVVFGILDNGIMLVAGEQIDHLFGAKMGLSMLASAGLGNMVADVVGVSATQTVQENMKRVTWARPPRLSMLQQQQMPVKAAQFVGAAVGVAVGCLIGMTPLAFMEPGFFVSAADAAAAAADAAAATAAALGGGGGGGEQAAAGAAAVAASAAAVEAAEAAAAAQGGQT
ncbi:Transmembrane 65 [Micractinium conductrix]|uniref:Transmembrane 65 n=1 Tax=Micractinium conductrix TaxID=554055 RepID=A0A2P6V521_9CHLO|nr:Transmembrane 65 [Micractinium conductrix]|eukprot:PSC69182.1 Transmembrane 65 [Micractinium conductrix]